MSLTRQTQKVFGSNADADQLAVFGTMKTGTPVYSTDLATLQSTAYTEGWSEAILDDKAPYLEEMNAVQYGLSYQIAYLLQEGVGAYDANTTYSNTSIVKVFDNGKLYFYHSLIDNNIGHSLSDGAYWEPIPISDTRNIGEIVTSTIPLSDAGLHLLDGSLLSGSGSYSQFVTYIANLYTANSSANYFCSEADWQTSVTNYGVCGKFVYDSVNNTVRLPKITGFVEGASGVSTLGNLTEAGLPNITGYFVAADDSRVTYGGAFYPGGQAGSGTGGGSAEPLVYFDASRSNSIYGNSNTVKPQSVKVLYYIVVATSVKTSIQVDIDDIATDVNGKADRDLLNLSNTGNIQMAGASMPSNTYVDLTLGASGSTYTALTNGYYCIGYEAGNDCYVSLRCHFGVEMSQWQQDNWAALFLPVNKGQQIVLDYRNMTLRYFRFYYAVGSESEAS